MLTMMSDAEWTLHNARYAVAEKTPLVSAFSAVQSHCGYASGTRIDGKERPFPLVRKTNCPPIGLWLSVRRNEAVNFAGVPCMTSKSPGRTMGNSRELR
jgi:hypothetical protein